MPNKRIKCSETHTHWPKNSSVYQRTGTETRTCNTHKVEQLSTVQITVFPVWTHHSSRNRTSWKRTWEHDTWHCHPNKDAPVRLNNFSFSFTLHLSCVGPLATLQPIRSILWDFGEVWKWFFFNVIIFCLVLQSLAVVFCARCPCWSGCLYLGLLPTRCDFWTQWRVLMESIHSHCCFSIGFSSYCCSHTVFCSVLWGNNTDNKVETRAAWLDF